MKWLEKLASLIKGAENNTTTSSIEASNQETSKDPLDFKLTDLSTPWKTDRYCPQCNNPTTHRERMSDICNFCGFYDRYLVIRYRRYRKIFYEGEWCYQILKGTENGRGTIIAVDEIDFKLQD